MVKQLTLALALSSTAMAQTPTPVSRVCSDTFTQAWEQSSTDIVDYWVLYVQNSPQSPWPKAEVIPVLQPTPRPGVKVYSRIIFRPEGEYFLKACNSGGCSNPSNVLSCIQPPTPTATRLPTPLPTPKQPWLRSY